MVDVCVLLAGSPYARFLDLNLFYWYTERIVSVVSRHFPFPIEQDVLNFIGGGSLALVTSFLICILLVYQCSKMLQVEDLNRHVQQVLSLVPGTEIRLFLRELCCFVIQGRIRQDDS